MTAPLRTDLDAFLYAPIGSDASGMPLTLLSALARLGVDPWDEAADLAHLPTESAMQRLVSLLATVPNGPAPGADAATTATRLVALLHRAPSPRVRPAGPPLDEALAPQSRRDNRAIYYLAALIFMLIAQWAMAIRQPQTPTNTSVAPTSRAN